MRRRRVLNADAGRSHGNRLAGRNGRNPRRGIYGQLRRDRIGSDRLRFPSGDRNGDPDRQPVELHRQLHRCIELCAGHGGSGHLDDRDVHRHGRLAGGLGLHDHRHRCYGHDRRNLAGHRAYPGRRGHALVRGQLPTFSPPVPAPPGPVNLPGTGPLFAAYLAISEQNYIGGITAGNVVLSACVPAGAVVIAPVAAPTMLPTAAPGNTLLYYSVTGAAGSTTCLITATDSQTPTASSANVGVVVTGGSGTGN